MIKYLTNYNIVDAELNSGNKIKDYRLDLLLNNGDIVVVIIEQKKSFNLVLIILFSIKIKRQMS